LFSSYGLVWFGSLHPVREQELCPRKAVGGSGCFGLMDFPKRAVSKPRTLHIAILPPPPGRWHGWPVLGRGNPARCNRTFHSSLTRPNRAKPASFLTIGCRGHPYPRPRAHPKRSREKMRCADFRVFSPRVQGPQPRPKEVRNPRWVPRLHNISSNARRQASGLEGALVACKSIGHLDDARVHIGVGGPGKYEADILAGRTRAARRIYECILYECTPDQSAGTRPGPRNYREAAFACD